MTIGDLVDQKPPPSRRVVMDVVVSLRCLDEGIISPFLDHGEKQRYAG